MAATFPSRFSTCGTSRRRCCARAGSRERVWMERLHWDYRASSSCSMQYLDNHMLPGYAALEAGQVTGYAFCVYEETKAVIGDVFALPGHDPDFPAPRNGAAGPAHEIEETLLRHLLETLLNSPQVDRIESQLLLHPAGAHAEHLSRGRLPALPPALHGAAAGRPLEPPARHCPTDLELRPWRDEDLNPAARLISDAYRGHPDSLINDQYRSVHGSLRFLHNIVRYAGCGVFSALASHVVVNAQPRAGGPGAGFARQPAERPHHSALLSIPTTAARAGPPAARRRRHRSSCARA